MFDIEKLDAVTQADLKEFDESRVRHRDIEVLGCGCEKCRGHRALEQQIENRRLFKKALRGIRRASAAQAI